MPTPTASVPARLLGLAQLGIGVALTVRPAQIAAAAAGAGQPAPRWLVRILGVRSLVQGAVTSASPTWPVVAGGVLVDSAHAASMVPLIAASPRYRRAAAISAAVALLGAGAGALAARAEPPPGEAAV